MNQIVITSDGSHTILVPELNEHYHSVHGAISESEHVFIKNGFDFSTSDPLHIFEAGFGTGLNAFLTALRSLNGNREVYYTTIEKYPLDQKITGSLNYPLLAGADTIVIFDLIHSSPWGRMHKICKNFSLNKIEGDLTRNKLSGTFDLIYFDAFGPDKQPEMWSAQVFGMISEVMVSGGILVTYSVKGEVKRNLRASGFKVARLQGPPGKWQMIRATKI